MKPYGHKRSDSKTCAWGCCGGGKANVQNRLPSDRNRVDKAAKHRARQEARRETRRAVFASSE